MTEIDLSVIIVNYNTWHFLQPCLESIFKYFKRITFEIIIVDNNSSDGSQKKIRQHFPEVALIENNENIGFAKANNIAIEIAKGKYFFLLNADTMVLNKGINGILEFLKKNKNIGILGVQQVNENNQPISSFSFNQTFEQHMNNMLMDSLYLHKFKRRVRKQFQSICRVGYVNGAAMIISKPLLEKIGLLDERFFFMAEEVDYCFRCSKTGFEVFYNPSLKVRHYGASGNSLTLWGLMQYHFSNLKLFEKYGKSRFTAIFIFVSWLITRIMYSFLSILMLREVKVNMKRIEIYLKTLLWHLTLGRVKFSTQYH